MSYSRLLFDMRHIILYGLPIFLAKIGQNGRNLEK